MAFSDPIVGGNGALILPSVHSPDYVAGVSGWTINKDGSSEFNDGTYRGEIVVGTAGASRIEVGPGDVINIYDSSNNLILTIGPNTGVKMIGTDGSYAQMFASAGLLTFLELNPPTVVGAPFLTAEITADEDGTADHIPTLSLTSPCVTGTGFGAVAGIDLNGTGKTTATRSIDMFAETINAEGPIQVKGETWHALTLQNGWTNRGGSDVTAQYRKVASPPNTVEIVGYIASGTITDGTTLFTLPVGYRPAHNIVFPVYTANVTAGRTALLTAKTDGTCTITFLSGATSVGFHCLIPLDA